MLIINLFAIGFVVISYLIAPEYVSVVITVFTGLLMIGAWVVFLAGKIRPNDPSLDMYDGDFLSTDDVPRYVENKDHTLKPIAKIDIHC